MATIKMTKDGIENDVHTDEVQNMKAHGWQEKPKPKAKKPKKAK